MLLACDPEDVEDDGFSPPHRGRDRRRAPVRIPPRARRGAGARRRRRAALRLGQRRGREEGAGVGSPTTHRSPCRARAETTPRTGWPAASATWRSPRRPRWSSCSSTGIRAASHRGETNSPRPVRNAYRYAQGRAGSDSVVGDFPDEPGSPLDNWVWAADADQFVRPHRPKEVQAAAVEVDVRPPEAGRRRAQRPVEGKHPDA